MDLGPTWNPRDTLNLQVGDKTTWSCAGTREDSRRCAHLICQGEAENAARLLDNMSRQMPDQIDYDDLLQLAHACLCTETPGSHRDSQTAEVIYRWTEAMANESCLLRAIATPLPKSRGLESGSARSAAPSPVRHENMAHQFARARSAFCSTPIPMDAAEVSIAAVRKAEEDTPLLPVLKQPDTGLGSASPAPRMSPSEAPPSPPPTPITPTHFANSPPPIAAIQLGAPATQPDTAVSPPHTPIHSSINTPMNTPIHTPIHTPITPNTPATTQTTPSPPDSPPKPPPHPHQTLLAAHQTRLQSRLTELQAHFTTLHNLDHARLTGALHLLLYALQVAACMPLAVVMLGESVGTLISELLPFAWDDSDEEFLVGEGDGGQSWKSRLLFGSGRRRGRRHRHVRRQMSFGLRDWTWVVNIGEGDQSEEKEKRKRSPD